MVQWLESWVQMISGLVFSWMEGLGCAKNWIRRWSKHVKTGSCFATEVSLFKNRPRNLFSSSQSESMLNMKGWKSLFSRPQLFDDLNEFAKTF